MHCHFFVQITMVHNYVLKVPKKLANTENVVKFINTNICLINNLLSISINSSVLQHKGEYTLANITSYCNKVVLVIQILTRGCGNVWSVTEHCHSVNFHVSRLDQSESGVRVGGSTNNGNFIGCSCSVYLYTLIPPPTWLHGLQFHLSTVHVL